MVLFMYNLLSFGVIKLNAVPSLIHSIIQSEIHNKNTSYTSLHLNPLQAPLQQNQQQSHAYESDNSTQHVDAVAARVYGYMSGVASLCQFLFQPGWGGLSDRYGRRVSLIGNIVGLTISCVLVTLASYGNWLSLVWISMTVMVRAIMLDR
jgi:MFS family permease